MNTATSVNRIPPSFPRRRESIRRKSLLSSSGRCRGGCRRREWRGKRVELRQLHKRTGAVPLSTRILARVGQIVVVFAVLAIPTNAHAAESATPAIGKTSDWRAAVRGFAEANLKHPAWGVSHSARDYDLARALAREDGVTLDDDVLYAAAYLHDVAAFAPFRKPNVDHQDEAANIVASLLEGTGFPMAKIEAVRGAIRTHMFERDPVGPEAIYLHDADALDWLGAIGVARIFALVDPNGGAPDGPSVVKRLEANLEKVPPRVISKAGKARAPELARELEQFLKNLKAQSSDYRTL